MMQELQPGDPQLIGPYRLRGRLGAGGMGRVYLGLSPGGRAVAVKVIRSDLAQDPEFRARFRREITVARRVIDFGISRAVEASALTHTGLVVGSPGFMSPEQAEGREVGPPSDIFSLGAVLAFAASGQGPFGTGSTPALVYRVVHSVPNLDRLRPEVRPLVERCLAKDPAQRPAAAQLLAGADAAHPATGWLPEPVTSTFSLEGTPLTVTASRLAAHSVPPPGRLAPPAGSGRPGAGRPHRRAGQRPWRSRWRPLTVAAILAGLAGAGATVGITMTAASTPAHAVQSVRRDAPTQTLAPVTPPASSSPATAAPYTPGADAEHLVAHHGGLRLLSAACPAGLAAAAVGAGEELEQVAVGVLEVHAAATVPAVDRAALGPPRIGPVRQVLFADPAEGGVELLLPHQERVVLGGYLVAGLREIQ